VADDYRKRRPCADAPMAEAEVQPADPVSDARQWLDEQGYTLADPAMLVAYHAHASAAERERYRELVRAAQRVFATILQSEDFGPLDLAKWANTPFKQQMYALAAALKELEEKP
jgi:hypothetical protein